MYFSSVPLIEKHTHTKQNQTIFKKEINKKSCYYKTTVYPLTAETF